MRFAIGKKVNADAKQQQNRDEFPEFHVFETVSAAAARREEEKAPGFREPCGIA
jgi:hypothetical protein